jgi:hypothetical protein
MDEITLGRVRTRIWALKENLEAVPDHSGAGGGGAHHRSAEV